MPILTEFQEPVTACLRINDLPVAASAGWWRRMWNSSEQRWRLILNELSPAAVEAIAEAWRRERRVEAVTPTGGWGRLQRGGFEGDAYIAMGIGHWSVDATAVERRIDLLAPAVDAERQRDALERAVQQRRVGQIWTTEDWCHEVERITDVDAERIFVTLAATGEPSSLSRESLRWWIPSL